MTDKTNNRYIFWLNDLSVLYTNDNYLQFVPNTNMTRTEQLNALTRFCIYFIILAGLLGKDDIWLQIPIIGIIFIIVLHRTFEFDVHGQRKELERMSSVNNESEPTNENADTNQIIEGCIYDSNGDLQIQDGKNAKKIKHTLDEIIKYKNATCRKPSKDNPFMNPTVNDFMLYDPPEACNVDDDQINDKIVDNFNADLYRDVGDLFEVKNNQRQFYTVPGPSIPDTVGLAKWLYGGLPTCKTSQQACYKYEDLRRKHDME